MENRQDRKKPPGTPSDLRQMDLWSAQSAPAASGSAPDTKVPTQISAPVAPAGGARGDGTRRDRADGPARNRGRSAPSVVPVTVSKPRALPAPPPGTPPALTRRQHELLDFLRRRAEGGDRPPSLTDICRELGLASRGSLHKQVVALVKAGLVAPMEGKQRGVRLLRAANDPDDRVPLLGAIAAGRPIEALAREESIALPAWLRASDGCYALRVRGDSMRDAGILDGDLVVIQPRQTARNGEMVVALIDEHEATLKRIEQRPGEVLLHAENPAYAPQRYAPDRVRIQGIVIGQLRRY